MRRLTTRLLAAALTLVAAVAVLDTTTGRTVAGWSDSAMFSAPASGGQWTNGDWDSHPPCMRRIEEGKETGPCTIESVVIGNEWDGGIQVYVRVSGVEDDERARIRFDMSTIQGTAKQWDWTAGKLSTWTGRIDSWKPPWVVTGTENTGVKEFALTFTTGG